MALIEIHKSTDHAQETPDLTQFLETGQDLPDFEPGDHFFFSGIRYRVLYQLKPEGINHKDGQSALKSLAILSQSEGVEIYDNLNISEENKFERQVTTAFGILPDTICRHKFKFDPSIQRRPDVQTVVNYLEYNELPSDPSIIDLSDPENPIIYEDN